VTPVGTLAETVALTVTGAIPELGVTASVAVVAGTEVEVNKTGALPTVYELLPLMILDEASIPSTWLYCEPGVNPTEAVAFHTASPGFPFASVKVHVQVEFAALMHPSAFAPISQLVSCP
jgi:hypothetical protein